MEDLQSILGRVYELMMAIACVLLLTMVAAITVDVTLRNLVLPGMPRGFVASNDISEYSLYFCTLLAAPWLLRAGQHIRVDILLRAIPSEIAWICEWISDLLGLAACVALACTGVVMTVKSYAAEAMQTRSLVVPEWWLLAALPVAFVLLSIEFVFRMWRLAKGPKAPRSDAVSAA